MAYHEASFTDLGSEYQTLIQILPVGHALAPTCVFDHYHWQAILVYRLQRMALYIWQISATSQAMRLRGWKRC